MEKIQATIKQLQKNLSELEYGLQLKEHPIVNVHDTVECEMIWKRQRTDEVQRSTTVEINEDDTGVESVNQDEEDIHDYSTNSTSTSYEHSLLSFLVANDSLPSMINKDDKPTLIDRKKVSSTKKPPVIKKNSSNETSTTINKKKRRCCINCGKC